jgi:hypothetical protein
MAAGMTAERTSHDVTAILDPHLVIAATRSTRESVGP